MSNFYFYFSLILVSKLSYSKIFHSISPYHMQQSKANSKRYFSYLFHFYKSWIPSFLLILRSWEPIRVRPHKTLLPKHAYNAFLISLLKIQWYYVFSCTKIYSLHNPQTLWHNQEIIWDLSSANQTFLYILILWLFLLFHYIILLFMILLFLKC